MTEWLVSEEQWQTAPTGAIRDGVGAALLQLGTDSWNVVAVCADLNDSIRFQGFAEKFPRRFFQVGVAEQNLIGVAAGLAQEGLTSFAGSYAAFCPGRTYDQIRVSVCYSGLNVKIVGGHAGLSVGPDGATHQMLEDIALMRALPQMSVVVPSSVTAARALTLQAGRLFGPVYIRSSRVASRTLAPESAYRFGEALRLRQGQDLTIIAAGIMGEKALQLAFDLEREQGITTEVLELHTVKPLDQEAILEAARRTGRVLTLEEHQVAGGLGSAVAEVLSQFCPTPLEIMGVVDAFGRSGEAEALLAAYGFSRGALLGRATAFLNRWLE